MIAKRRMLGHIEAGLGQQAMARIPAGGFKRGRQLEKWLNGLPKDHIAPFSRVIILRAALRTLSYGGRQQYFLSYFAVDAFSGSLTLAIFRASAIRRFAVKYHIDEVERAANAAAGAARTAAHTSNLLPPVKAPMSQPSSHSPPVPPAAQPFPTALPPMPSPLSPTPPSMTKNRIGSH